MYMCDSFSYNIRPSWMICVMKRLAAIMWAACAWLTTCHFLQHFTMWNVLSFMNRPIMMRRKRSGAKLDQSFSDPVGWLRINGTAEWGNEKQRKSVRGAKKKIATETERVLEKCWTSHIVKGISNLGRFLLIFLGIACVASSTLVCDPCLGYMCCHVYVCVSVCVSILPVLWRWLLFDGGR